MLLFFDTETTGLPKNWNAPETDIDNWPRMVQIAWQQFDNKQQLLSKKSYIIKPNGFVIPNDVVKIHGITTQRAEKEGVPLQDALNEFSAALKSSKFLIAHNIGYDRKITGAEFHRNRIKHTMHEMELICTMHKSTDFCRIPGGYPYKWPKLPELHKKLFNTPFEESHNAEIDVDACARCFFELVKKGVIRLKN